MIRRGWYNESVRHSLAAKGVATSYLLRKKRSSKFIKFGDTEKKLMHEVTVYRRALKEIKAKKHKDMRQAERDRLNAIRVNFVKKREIAKRNLEAHRDEMGVSDRLRDRVETRPKKRKVRKELTEEDFIEMAESKLNRVKKTKKTKKKKKRAKVVEDDDDYDLDEEFDDMNEKESEVDFSKFSAKREVGEELNPIFMQNVVEKVEPVPEPVIVDEREDPPREIPLEKAFPKSKAYEEDASRLAREIADLKNVGGSKFQINKKREEFDKVRVKMGKIKPEQAFHMDDALKKATRDAKDMEKFKKELAKTKPKPSNSAMVGNSALNVDEK